MNRNFSVSCDKSREFLCVLAFEIEFHVEDLLKAAIQFSKFVKSFKVLPLQKQILIAKSYFESNEIRIQLPLNATCHKVKTPQSKFTSSPSQARLPLLVARFIKHQSSKLHLWMRDQQLHCHKNFSLSSCQSAKLH